MKKIFCIISTVAVLFLASSCGNRGAKNVESSVSDSTEVAVSDSTVVDTTEVAE